VPARARTHRNAPLSRSKGRGVYPNPRRRKIVALKGSFCVGLLPAPGGCGLLPPATGAAATTELPPAAAPLLELHDAPLLPPGATFRMECDGSLGAGPTKPTKPTKASKVWSVTKSLYTNELCQRPTNRPKSAETSPNPAQYAQFLQPLVGWSVQRAKPLSSNELVNRPKPPRLVGSGRFWSVRPPSLVTTLSLGCNEFVVTGAITAFPPSLGVSRGTSGAFVCLLPPLLLSLHSRWATTSL
jgi:hypothetical protein